MKNISPALRLRALLTSACVVAASFVLPAYAADPVAKKTSPQQSGKVKPKPMSRDQLRSCMDQQDRLTLMRENVLKEQTSLDQQRAEVKAIDAELERKRAVLDPADAVAKQALQDEETRRNQIGETYNARLPVLKEQGAALDKERQNWVERCADKDFDMRDEVAIKRERAAKAAGAKTPK
jgi:hypothetical protein